MIISLTLKCFRQHINKTFNFTRGLNVLRGENEAGKTGVMEAIAYAQFGARALRNGLTDAVSWGHKEKDLKVTLVQEINGITYTIERSKGGASVNYPDSEGLPRLVTGQAEVTSFIANALGADLKASSFLQMASQGSLRGALEEGPAAVTLLMSKLADFDLIDRLLDVATKRMPMGSSAMLEASIESRRTRLAELLAAVLPDPADAQRQLDAAEAAVSAAGEALVRAEIEWDAFNAAALAADRAADAVTATTKDVARVQSAIEMGQQRASELRAEAAAHRVDPEALVKARTLVSQAKDAERLQRAAALLVGAQYPDVFWDEPEDTFRAALTDAAASAAVAKSKLQALQQELAKLMAQPITSGAACRSCGHVNPDRVAAERHQREHLAVERARIEGEIASAEADARGTAATLAALRGVEAAAARYISIVDQARALAPEMVKFDPEHFPPRASWAGGAVVSLSLRAAEEQLATLEAHAQRATRALMQVDLSDEQVKKLQSVDLPDIQATLRMQQEEHQRWVGLRDSRAPASSVATVRTHYETCRFTAGACRQAVRRAHDDLERQHQQICEVQAAIAEGEEMVKKMAFGTELVKRLKEIKPAITDHLWGRVLSGTSSYFTQMRGTPSVVTKVPEGFMVNDRPVSSLSGSTIDVLALAVRCSLVRVFSPQIDYLSLDEPAAGCSTERSSNVLSFVSSTGFEQTIMASHDPVSESVADNVIYIGA